MVPWVPTGMKAGVSKEPWAVVMRATREFDCESVERIWKRRDICIEIVGFGLVDGHWWGAVKRFWTGEVDWVESFFLFHFFFQAEDGIRDLTVTGVQTCALPI